MADYFAKCLSSCARPSHYFQSTGCRGVDVMALLLPLAHLGGQRTHVQRLGTSQSTCHPSSSSCRLQCSELWVSEFRVIEHLILFVWGAEFPVIGIPIAEGLSTRITSFSSGNILCALYYFGRLGLTSLYQHTGLLPPLAVAPQVASPTNCSLER